MKSFAVPFLAACLLVPQLARADHGPPTAGTIDELVVQFQGNLDHLADEYFLDPGETPNFDEPRFNSLVGRARIALERARRSIARGRVCNGMMWLTHSVRRLDQATSFAQEVGMSGSGFSDDLASLTAARAQFFLEDLIVLAAGQPGMDPMVIAIAAYLEDVGDDAGGPDSGDWMPALRAYTRGVCMIYRQL